MSTRSSSSDHDVEFLCAAHSMPKEDVDSATYLASAFVPLTPPRLDATAVQTPYEVSPSCTPREDTFTPIAPLDFDVSTESSGLQMPMTSVHTSAIKLPSVHPTRVTEADLLR